MAVVLALGARNWRFVSFKSGGETENKGGDFNGAAVFVLGILLVGFCIDPKEEGGSEQPRIESFREPDDDDDEDEDNADLDTFGIAIDDDVDVDVEEAVGELIGNAP